MERTSGSHPRDASASAESTPRGLAADGRQPDDEAGSTGSRAPSDPASRPSGGGSAGDDVDTRRQRARLGSALIAEQSRLRRRHNYDSTGLLQAGESGRNRRRESEDRQQRLIDEMSQINQSTRVEEELSRAVSASAASLSSRPRGHSRGGARQSSYEAGPVPGEMVSGGRPRGPNRRSRADDLEEAIRDGLEEHHEQSPSWDSPGLMPFRSVPVEVGLDSVLGGLPLSGGPDELLRALLASRDSFLDQAEEMQMAMAMSLSLEDQGGNVSTAENMASDHMSYENLVELEDVRVTVPQAAIRRFPTHTFGSSTCPTAPDNVCAICQVEFEAEEELLALPCDHMYHKECASEWLAKYSKNCPVCKTEAWDG